MTSFGGGHYYRGGLAASGGYAYIAVGDTVVKLAVLA